MATRLQLRRDTAANWTSVDTILLAGEMAVETNTGKFKVGDGTTAWTSLAYSSGIQGLTGADGANGTDGATWLSGAIDPTTEGADGDFYLNTVSYDVFKKVSGAWGTTLLNIKGDTGATGATGDTAGRGVSFYVDDVLEVGTDLMNIIAPLGLTITGVRANVSIAPTGADLIIDINKNGTTLYTTQGNRPTILATETSETATLPDVTSISLGDIISIDIDQIGSTVAGGNLSVVLICEVA